MLPGHESRRSGNPDSRYWRSRIRIRDIRPPAVACPHGHDSRRRSLPDSNAIGLRLTVGDGRYRRIVSALQSRRLGGEVVQQDLESCRNCRCLLGSISRAVEFGPVLLIVPVNCVHGVVHGEICVSEIDLSSGSRQRCGQCDLIPFDNRVCSQAACVKPIDKTAISIKEQSDCVFMVYLLRFGGVFSAITAEHAIPEHPRVGPSDLIS